MLKQIGIAHGTVGELVRSVHARTLLSVERALWTWTVYARFHAEKWCEVWPAVDKRDNAALERAQRRALVAILGHAAPPRARIFHIHGDVWCVGGEGTRACRSSHVSYD